MEYQSHSAAFASISIEIRAKFTICSSSAPKNCCSTINSHIWITKGNTSSFWKSRRKKKRCKILEDHNHHRLTDGSNLALLMRRNLMNSSLMMTLSKLMMKSNSLVPNALFKSISMRIWIYHHYERDKILLSIRMITKYSEMKPCQ